MKKIFLTLAALFSLVSLRTFAAPLTQSICSVDAQVNFRDYPRYEDDPAVDFSGCKTHFILPYDGNQIPGESCIVELASGVRAKFTYSLNLWSWYGTFLPKGQIELWTDYSVEPLSGAQVDEAYKSSSTKVGIQSRENNVVTFHQFLKLTRTTPMKPDYSFSIETTFKDLGCASLP